ncbi:hypothetical protein PPTG_23439 [Phytophthora nicotianae INRA-310]|uniref:Uncharacterized protein n=1 Tax=Phytophthora nicotianae (strain INRA-310) TaxID=761204 RepID=W2PY42_PHYN3|nr:hypothetical protein PPTG_23439 [Phytophthora nicotianae INRA-310]ETN05787.1 hypothetical protein PPTG_23439 [Phytophthora nicotianae INRA-310]
MSLMNCTSSIAEGVSIECAGDPTVCTKATVRLLKDVSMSLHSPGSVSPHSGDAGAQARSTGCALGAANPAALLALDLAPLIPAAPPVLSEPWAPGRAAVLACFLACFFALILAAGAGFRACSPLPSWDGLP